MYYSTVSLQVSVPFVAKSILQAFRRAESPSRSARPGRQQGPRASRRASCRWSCGAPRCERGGTVACWGRRTAGCLAQLGLGRSRCSGHGHCAGCRSRHDTKPTAALLAPASRKAASSRAHDLRHQAQLWRTNADLSRPKSACGAQGTLHSLQCPLLATTAPQPLLHGKPSGLVGGGA